MPAPDNIDEGLRAPLSEFFEALEETLRNAEARGAELTGRDALLAIVNQHVGPALDLEMQAAGSSGTATTHLLHLLSVLVDRAGLPRRGAAAAAYQPLVAANKRLKEAINAAQRRHENETTTELEDLRDLIRAVPGHVYDQLRPIFAVVESTVQEVPGQTAVQLAPAFAVVESTVQEVPGQVAVQLAPTFTALGNAVQAVPGQVAVQLAPSFTALGTAIQGLPAQLAQSLPGPIAQAVVAATAAAQAKVANDLAALSELATTPLNTAIRSPAAGIGFL